LRTWLEAQPPRRLLNTGCAWDCIVAEFLLEATSYTTVYAGGLWLQVGHGPDLKLSRTPAWVHRYMSFVDEAGEHNVTHTITARRALEIFRQVA
jgi:hypothetical protein